MSTQAQGKGKKKNKEVTKVSLDEFHQIEAPHGHSVVNLKMTGLDWAATMADHDQQATETQQVIVPTAPRAQRGPAIEYSSLPTNPPFRVSLFNWPMSAEEHEISKYFFNGIEVVNIESSKASTTVELATRDDLYEALSRDGNQVKGRTISVCLYGQSPQNNYGSDKYGGRGGSAYGDRYGDRNSGFGGSRGGERYGDRPGSYGRDRDREGFSGFNRAGSYGQPSRGGYGENFNEGGGFRDNIRGSYTSGGGEPVSEEPANWRARPAVKPSVPSPPSSYNGSRQPYTHSRHETSQHYNQHTAPPHQQYQNPEPRYQPRYQHHNPPSNHSPYPPYNSQASYDRPPAAPSNEERPKLVLKKPTKTSVDLNNVTRNEAIFGKAMPTSTPYEKMKEVEEKLKSVHIVDKDVKPLSQSGSQSGSRPGSAPRSRRVSSNHSESNN